jgi:hypothetical protein
MSDPAEEEADYRAYAKGSAIELATTAYCAVSPDLSGDIADFDLTYALDVRGYLEALQSAVREARKQLDSFIAAKLEGVQYYRHRDQIIRPGQGGTWKVKNPDYLRSWVETHDAWDVVNLAASGAVTVTRLKERAVLIGANPETVAETFMERVPSGGPITVLRPQDAPKKAQALPDGGKIERKPRLEGKE